MPTQAEYEALERSIRAQNEQYRHWNGLAVDARSAQADWASRQAIAERHITESQQPAYVAQIQAYGPAFQQREQQFLRDGKDAAESRALDYAHNLTYYNVERRRAERALQEQRAELRQMEDTLYPGRREDRDRWDYYINWEG